MSKLEKSAVAVWRGGTAFDVTAGSGHRVLADGDAKAGQSPMELVLSGLVGCTSADVISILKKKRQDVTELVVTVHGQRCEEHPRVYTHVQMVFSVTGHGVDPEAVRRAIELSETKYCSVLAMLRARAEITITFEVHEAEPDLAGHPAGPAEQS